MNFRKGGLIIAGILLVATIFLNRSDVQLSSQADFSVTKITASGYELKSVVKLHNPNLLSSTIHSINEKFYLNDIFVGEFNNELEQGIPGRKDTDFPLNIRFSQTDVHELFAGDTLLQKKCRVTVKGEIVFSNLTGGGKITVNQTGYVIISK